MSNFFTVKPVRVEARQIGMLEPPRRLLTIAGPAVFVPGNWLVMSPDGQFYPPLTDEQFKATFDPAPDPDSGEAADRPLAPVIQLARGGDLQ